MGLQSFVWDEAVKLTVRIQSATADRAFWMEDFVLRTERK